MDDLERELAPPRVIDAELVPAPKKKTGSYPLTPKEIRKRDRVFTNVSVLKDRKYYYGRMSDRERKAISILLKTGSVAKAAEEIGVTPQTIYNYTKRPFVRAYLEQMRERLAGAADLTQDKVARVVNAAVDGVESVTPQQLQAAAIAAKLLNPTARNGSPITINQQNNFSVGASPFQGLDQGGMLDEIKRNLLEMGHEPPAAP